MFLHGFMSFAAVCVTVACLIIMGSFCLISFNIHEMIVDLEQENQVLVYVDEHYPEAEAKSVGSQLNMIANIEQSIFVSRQQALDHFIAEQDDATVFEGIVADTFRDRFVVKLVDNSKMEQTVEEIQQVEGVADVNAHYEISKGFETLQNIINLASYAIILILFVVSLFIISNTVKLAMYDRREEIAIMKMVGATNSFIRWPFVVEGSLLGIVGAVVGFLIEWGIYDLLAARIAAVDTLQLITIIPFTEVLPLMLPIYLAMGLLIGVLGSILSIRKFLQV